MLWLFWTSWFLASASYFTASAWVLSNCSFSFCKFWICFCKDSACDCLPRSNSFWIESSASDSSTLVVKRSSYSHPSLQTSCLRRSSASRHLVCCFWQSADWASYCPFSLSYCDLARSRSAVAVSSACFASFNAFSTGESRWTKSSSWHIAARGWPQSGQVVACSATRRWRKAFRSSSRPNLRVLYWVRTISWFFWACENAASAVAASFLAASNSFFCSARLAFVLVSSSTMLSSWVRRSFQFE